ncbi:hypothetical protein F2P81_023401 [Scophthalmus maximus]|uniref:DDE Tnp4 domain-containing protein n=1 Tax=Scophthalmus maximus TaxID=52904 RepID=A0A6A4RWB7_SCOMX|nr:hypothetical protein F2P81_023401 [Scophthalmus maximus]
MCDHQCQFLDVFIGYPGSVHDARVLKNSHVYVRSLYLLEEYCNLGDGGYPCMSQPIALITPYREPVRGAVAARFNRHHAKARSVIERALVLVVLSCTTSASELGTQLNLWKRHRDRMTELVSSRQTSSVGNSCVGTSLMLFQRPLLRLFRTTTIDSDMLYKKVIAWFLKSAVANHIPVFWIKCHFMPLNDEFRTRATFRSIKGRGVEHKAPPTAHIRLKASTSPIIAKKELNANLFSFNS